MNQENKPAEKPAKLVTIFVNTKEVNVTKDKYSYEEIVALAFANPDYNGFTYKVTYFWDPGKKDGHLVEGTLTKGESINVKDGMSFTVANPVKS